MNRPAIFSLLVFFLATSALCEEVELTGLIDLAGCRMACFRILHSGATPVLRPGESAEGITLESLDVRTGMARVLSGRRPLRLKLASFCALPTKVANNPTLQATRAQNTASPNVGAAEGTPLSLAASAGDRGMEHQPDDTRRFTRVAAAGMNAPATGSPATRAPQPQEFSEPVGGPVDGDSETIASPGTTAPTNTDKPVHHPLPENDPAYAEGEQIKMQYGLEAFLAWDLARGQAALEGK